MCMMASFVIDFILSISRQRELVLTSIVLHLMYPFMILAMHDYRIDILLVNYVGTLLITY